MAYNFVDKETEEKYRTKSYSEESIYKCVLKINENTVPMEQIESIVIKDPIIDTESQYFYLGTFFSKSITIKFRNLDGLDIKSGNEVSLDISQYIDEETGYVNVPIGKFLIDDLEEDYTTSCEITCLDYAVKFKPNIDYSLAFDENGEITIDNLLKYICNHFGVELGNYPSTNGNVKISVLDSTLSGKLYISYISELKASNVKMDRLGKLCMIPLKGEPVAKLDASKGESWNIGELYKVSRVYYEDAIRRFEKGTKDNNTLRIRSDNPFIIDQSVIDNIYNSVEGTEIYSVKCRNYGDLSLDAFDTIEYTAKGKKYKTLYDNTTTYEMTVMSEVDTTIPTAQQNECVNVVGGTEEAKYRIVKTLIDQANGNIVLITKETQNIQDNLNDNYYTITKTNELIQNANKGLTNTFSEAGGNNIFRNTGLWFAQNDEENPYEYWIGKVKRISNNKSANSNSMLIQKGTLTQNEKVPNGKYTVSFKYKKLIELADCKVKINDITYDLTEITDTEFVTGETNNKGEYITQPLNIDNNHIEISFISDTDNSVEIYDLMVNAGSVKLAYSQNQNETTTDTVNISKGITISSSNIETQFKANADGIRTINKSGEVLSEYTDKGMKNKQMEITDEAQIVGALMQDVNEQTWVTRL